MKDSQPPPAVPPLVSKLFVDVGASCYLSSAQEGDPWLPRPISYQPQQRVSVVRREEQLGNFEPPGRARGLRNDELER